MVAIRQRTGQRQRPVARISAGRASRLRRIVILLGQKARRREDILTEIGIGLRTYYRELVLIKRCGIKVTLRDGAYGLGTSVADAEGKLPFPDPQLSFAEMIELAALPGEASARLAGILARVTKGPDPSRKRKSDRAAARPGVVAH